MDSSEFGESKPLYKHIPNTITQDVNPIAHVLLAGCLLPNRSLFRILTPELVALIFHHLRQSWVTALVPGYDNVDFSRPGNVGFLSDRDEPPSSTPVTLARIARTVREENPFIHNPTGFPEPKYLFCNMLPFISNDDSTIPPEYHGYLHLIDICRRYARIASYPGDTWYLTIHESKVNFRTPQRRRGIHTEGFLASPGKYTMFWHRWGWCEGGGFDGGIYHASTVDASCRMWNVNVPREISSVLQQGCDLEHLRGVLNEFSGPIEPRAGELYWMSDATPHESLPLKPGTYRQYFRLVTGKITAWWKQHSTENRLGTRPDCAVLTHSKFEEGAFLNLAEKSESAGPS